MQDLSAFCRPIESVMAYLADSGRRREWLVLGHPARPGIGDTFSLHIKLSDYWPADYAG